MAKLSTTQVTAAGLTQVKGTTYAKTVSANTGLTITLQDGPMTFQAGQAAVSFAAPPNAADVASFKATLHSLGLIDMKTAVIPCAGNDTYSISFA